MAPSKRRVSVPCAEPPVLKLKIMWALNEVAVVHDVAHAPIDGVESFAGGADGEGVPRKCRVLCAGISKYLGEE